MQWNYKNASLNRITVFITYAKGRNKLIETKVFKSNLKLNINNIIT